MQAIGNTLGASSIERSVTTFNCLPPEILTQLIVNLEGDDRKNFGSLNNRLERLEKLAGHRRFSIIEFNANSPYLMRAQSGGAIHNFGCLLHVEMISEFFHQAIAERVAIKGPSLQKHEETLFRILKTAKFRKLDIEINNEDSCKILTDILHHFPCIKEATIRWNIDGVKMDKAQISGLPTMSRYSIVAVNHKGFITDDALLGVIGTSTGSINLYSPQPEVTSEGIAEAFRMIYTDRNQRSVFYYAPREEVTAFVGRLDQFRFNVTDNTIKHVASGATLTFNDNSLVEGASSVKMTNYPSSVQQACHASSCYSCYHHFRPLHKPRTMTKNSHQSDPEIKIYFEFSAFDGKDYLIPFPTFEHSLFEWLKWKILQIIHEKDVQLFWRGGNVQYYLNGDCDLKNALNYAEDEAKKHPGTAAIVEIELQRVRDPLARYYHYAKIRNNFKKKLIEMEAAIKMMETAMEEREKALAEREKRLAERAEKMKKVVRGRMRKQSAEMGENMIELKMIKEEIAKIAKRIL